MSQQIQQIIAMELDQGFITQAPLSGGALLGGRRRGRKRYRTRLSHRKRNVCGKKSRPPGSKGAWQRLVSKYVREAARRYRVRGCK